MTLDCNELPGRLRDICRGYDDNGNPILNKEKRDQYIHLFEHGVGRPKLTKAEREELLLKKYHEAWHFIHTYPLIHQHDWDSRAARKQFNLWEKTIPLACECRTHWKEVKKRHPPKFKTWSEFFEFTNTVHNEVNERLGKPLIPLQEAYTIWTNKLLSQE